MIPPSAWTIVLTDWKNCSADVTVTLRSGASFSGKVTKVESDGIFGDIVDLQFDDYPEKRKIAIDLAEVVAVEAIAS